MKFFYLLIRQKGQKIRGDHKKMMNLPLEVSARPQFIITKMKVGNFEVSVPEGLSELLNDSGAWVIRTNKSKPNNQYERRVEKKDGNIVTFLTLKR